MSKADQIRERVVNREERRLAAIEDIAQSLRILSIPIRQQLAAAQRAAEDEEE